VADAIEELLLKRRVLVTVGAGGVGKTTTAAALGVAAAARGKRVLCLTIDPAKRLAESLGLDAMTTEEVVVEPGRFERAGVRHTGSLTVMMLDTKRTFDELVRKHSSTPEKAERLLENRLYQYVSTSLAGTQEYMAMEKLVAVKHDPRYDLIVLDTPPTANAIDFLDAPERLMGALDSAAMRWFVEAFQSTGKLSFNVLAKSASVVLRTIGKITGGGLLQDMARLISELNELFGGFRERAALVQRELRSREVDFVLVTSPAPMSVREVLYFSERLESSNMPRGAFIVNRLRVAPRFPDGAPAEAVTSALRARSISLEEDAESRLQRAHRDQCELAALDIVHVDRLARAAGGKVPVVRVPEFASDVRDIRLLGDVADLLVSGGV
jgi:anion-transporting  ArsA/GET3 family ATPase